MSTNLLIQTRISNWCEKSLGKWIFVIQPNDTGDTDYALVSKAKHNGEKMIITLNMVTNHYIANGVTA